jgi:putative Mn2+ efflux pump MntP
MFTILTAFIFLAVFTSILSFCFGVDAVLTPVRIVRNAVTTMGSKLSTMGSRIGERVGLSIHGASAEELKGPRWK